MGPFQHDGGVWGSSGLKMSTEGGGWKRRVLNLRFWIDGWWVLWQTAQPRATQSQGAPTPCSTHHRVWGLRRVCRELRGCKAVRGGTDPLHPQRLAVDVPGCLGKRSFPSQHPCESSPALGNRTSEGKEKKKGKRGRENLSVHRGRARNGRWSSPTAPLLRLPPPASALASLLHPAPVCFPAGRASSALSECGCRLYRCCCCCVRCSFVLPRSAARTRSCWWSGAGPAGWAR